MKKKVFSAVVMVVVVALCCVALAACNGGNPANKNKTYKIGCSGPLTGDAASYGISVQNGAKLAVKQINAAGGLNGKNFEFLMMDDEADPAKANTSYNTMYDQGMQASLGGVTSGACTAFAELAREDNMFMMTPSASAAQCIKDANAYRICFGDPDQGVFAANELGDNYTKIGVIYNSEDPYSQGIYDAFMKKMTEKGKAGNVTAKSFTKATNKDFATQANALKDSEVVFLPFYYQEAALVIKEFKDNLKSATKFFGCDGLDGLDKYMGDKKDLVVGIKYFTPFDANSKEENVAKFVNAYKAEYNTTPDQFAADGYDAFMSIYEAMKVSNATKEIPVNVNANDLCELLKGVFNNGTFTFTGATGTIKWSANGEPTKPIAILEIK